MKKLFLFILLIPFITFAKEKYFVIERETSSVAIIENHKFKSRLENLHNLNHAVIKFYEKDGYLITRDGYLIKFDPINEKVLKEIKVGESSIGIVIEEDYVAVANYSNKSVIILDRDLNIKQTIETGSRNVGIKSYKDYLVFSLMDKDQIWVLKKSKEKFERFKTFENVGEVPFDAMQKDNLYIVGFFNSPFIGVLYLHNFNYKQIKLFNENSEPVLKVPHFGTWSIYKDKIIIPAVGDKKVYVFDENFKPIKTIKTVGLPVFTSISPDGRFMAITFSGKEFPYLQIVDMSNFEIVKTLNFDGKVLHVRWSKEEPLLYVSVNDSNKVVGISIDKWEESFSVEVIKPSGIFIYEE